MHNFCRRQGWGIKKSLAGLKPDRSLLILSACLIISLFSSLLFSTAFMTQIVDKAYYLLLRASESLAHNRTSPADSRVVIIAIDDYTLAQPDELSVPGIFQHHYYTEIINGLHRGGAGVVVIARVLPRVKNPPATREEVDNWFAMVRDVAPEMPILSGLIWFSQRLVYPVSDYLLAMDSLSFGFLNLNRDEDGKVRRQNVRWPDCSGNFGCSSLSWLAAKALKPDLAEPSGEIYIDFDPRTNAIPIYSFYRVYQKAVAGDEDFFRRSFQGRIVLIGQINSLVKGSWPTPFSGQIRHGDTEVEVTAQAIKTLLNDCPMRALGWGGEFVLNFLLAAVALLPLLFSSNCGQKYPWLWLPLAMIPVVLGLSILAFVQRLYLPAISASASLCLAQVVWLIVRAGESRLAASTSRMALSLYLNPLLADNIVRHPELLTRGGERVEMSVFFSDLVSFTAMAEHISPEKLLDSLNEYFQAMEPIISQSGGILDKFDGDSIMAFWGSPLIPRRDHAADACLAALTQQTALACLNAVFMADGRPPLAALMGLTSGPMVVGNIGAENRINYTAMGDAVNLASRLVSVNKVYQTQIIISEATARAAASKVELRALDHIAVFGRIESIRIYELLAHKGALTDDVKRGRELYEAALDLYYRRDFQKALGLFEETMVYIQGDGPSELMARRCRDFLATPPADDWTGVTALNTK